MTYRKLSISCFAIIGVLALVTPGCGEKGPDASQQTSTAPPQQTAPAGTKPPTGGSTADQTLYAAPAGTKFGDMTGGAAKK